MIVARCSIWLEEAKRVMRGVHLSIPETCQKICINPNRPYFGGQFQEDPKLTQAQPGWQAEFMFEYNYHIR